MQPNSFDPNGQPQPPQPNQDPQQPAPQPASFTEPAPLPPNPFFASADPAPQPIAQPEPEPAPQPPVQPVESVAPIQLDPQPQPLADAPVQDPIPAPAQPIQDPVAPVVAVAPVAADGPKPRNMKLIIILIVGGVLLLAGIAVGAYFVFSNMKSDGESPVGTITGSITGPKETIDRTDGTLDLSSTVEGTTGIDNQNVNASLNQQVNLKNGLSLMVTKVERNFTAFNEKYVSVADDEEVVAVTLVAGSRNTNGNGVVTSALELTAPSNPGIRPEFISSLAELEGKFDSGSGLDQGQQVSGRLLYAVKKDEKPLSLHYSAQYKNYSTDEQVSIVVTFAL